MTNAISLLIGWLLDLLFGDPARLPHPIVWFGKTIAWGEHRLNRWSSESHESSLSDGRVAKDTDEINHGAHRKAKGALLTVTLILGVFAASWLLREALYFLPQHLGEAFGVRLGLRLRLLFDALVIFYCLAGTTLIREVRAVFLALDRSLDEGRKQVARIVGRDTSELTAQEVRTAALETLAENLSDGVIAPLFWLALLGTPGMLAYKMVNTLDSMIGYKTERYRDFGCWAAHIDDVANYIPARLTALLMVVAAGKPQLTAFVWKNGRNHASPNSGYPEAALAGILDCRFGGPHYYFGQLFPKPYIGDNDRPLTTADMKIAVRVNRTAEALMVFLVLATFLVFAH
jgi:adenosylcobinamide-phosphate synthase